MRKSNLTYEELIELAPKDRPFQIEYTTYDNKKETLWASIVDTYEDGDIELFTDFIGTQTGRYEFIDDEYTSWKNSKIKFTLIDEYRNMYEKPEVLKVGTEVEILESARDVEYYRENIKEITDQIGALNIIDEVRDDDYGIYYETKKGYRFPHYCVRPVEKVEEKIDFEEMKGIPGFDGMIEEFEGLCIKAQDIINKYKK